MSGLVGLGLRAAALLWTLLITALIGNVMASNVDAAGSASAAVNFTMFVAALSWVVCLYGLASAFVPALGRGLVLLPLDAAAALFTFISAVVLAAKLRAVNCARIPDSHLPASWVAFGSADDEKRCRELQASTVFMWFLCLCFCAGLFLTVKETRGPGSVRASRPSMSQVGV